jgi:hypothetical protein
MVQKFGPVGTNDMWVLLPTEIVLAKKNCGKPCNYIEYIAFP